MNPETEEETVLSLRFEAALIYAARLHQHQRRKITGVPYICHLLAVAALVIEAGGCEDSAIAALLHDAIEDQGGSATRLEIEKQFGAQVANWVQACSARHKTEGESWRSHKRSYLAKVSAAPLAVKQIVLADKLHNGRALLANLSRFGPEAWSAFSGSPSDILWFYQSCCELLSDSQLNTRSLLEVTTQIESLQKSAKIKR